MFNSSKRIPFGLDISDRTLKIVQLKQQGDDVLVASYGTKIIPQSIVRGGEIKKPKEFVEVLKKALTEVKGEPLLGKEVVCSLPEESVFVRVIQLPKMKDTELSKAVRWEAEAHIPLPVNKVYLDWQILPSPKNSPNISIMIAAISKKIVDTYFAVLKETGLKTVAFEPESLAIVRALMPRDNVRPTIVADIGLTGTNFVIFSSSAIKFSSHGNISGYALNEAIKEKLDVSSKEANDLKVEVGLDKTKKKGGVYKAILPIIEELAKQLEEYLDFYKRELAKTDTDKEDIKEIILCGGDSLLINIDTFLTQKLKIPVKRGDPLTNLLARKQKEIFAQKDKAFDLLKKKNVSYTTALGLALRETDDYV